jgi:hypothetical protein
MIRIRFTYILLYISITIPRGSYIECSLLKIIQILMLDILLL